MQRPCYECQLNRHAFCIDVNCLCLTCIHQSKEQEPRVWPLREPWLAGCVLN